MSIPKEFEGFRIPKEDEKKIIDLVKELKQASEQLEAVQKEAKIAIQDYLRNFVFEKTARYIELNNKLRAEFRRIDKKFSAEYTELVNEDRFEGDLKNRSSNYILRLRRMVPDNFPDSREFIEKVSGLEEKIFHIEPRKRDCDLFMGKYLAAAEPADTREHVLAAMGIFEGEAPDIDLESLFEDLGDELTAGLEGLSKEELADFLSTLEDGPSPDELEKMIGKLEG